MINGVNFGDADITRLLKVLNHETSDRVPYLEYWISSKEVKDYVLGRKARLRDVSIDNPNAAGQYVVPEDEVEFAERIGMDAVGCRFSFRPNNLWKQTGDGDIHYIGGTIKTRGDLSKLESPPDIGEQVQLLENYLEAAEKSPVGVYANVTSFFAGTYLAMGPKHFMYMIYDDLDLVKELMDIILEKHIRMVEAICQYDEVDFVLIDDDIAYGKGLMIRPALFRELFIPRLEKLIAPIKKRGKILTYHTDGNLEEVIPILLNLGFSAIHPVEPGANNIYELHRSVAGKLCVMGNIESSLLTYGTSEQIEKDVAKHIEKLKGGDYVVSSANSIFRGIPPEKYLVMINAIHKYGSC